MAINPAIALGVKGIEVQDPLERYGRMMAVQSAQQQNALAQIQMQQAQREQESTNALNRAYAEAYNPQTGDVDMNRLRTSIASGGFGSRLPEIEMKLGELKTQRLAQQKAEGEVLDSALKRSRSFLETIDPNSPGAADEYIAWHEANHRDPILGPALAARGISANQSRARIMQMMNTPGGLAQLINESKLGTEKFMELNNPQLSTTDVGGQVISRTFKPLTGEFSTIASQRKTMAPGEAQRISNEGRRLAIMEQNAAREADPVFQQRMEAARAMGRKIGEGDVAAMQALPEIISRAEGGVKMLDELVGKRDSKGNLIEGSKPHPGFETAVGATWLPGLRFIHGTDTTGFMTRFGQINGSSFRTAFESLKGAGSITEKEGEKGTQAINRMSVSTSEKEFVQAAMDLKDVLRKGVENAQKRASKVGVPAVPNKAEPPKVKFLGFE